MAKITSFRTSDSSGKITTYLYDNSRYVFAFDFGSNEIPLNDVKNIDYMFITHEHSDHFMGLYNLDYAKVLLESGCEIYASNVTKELIIAIFENIIRVDLDKKATNTIRELLHSIKGVLFFENIKINKQAYFRIFPSGHTFGSAMIYLHDEACKILYTGDIDCSPDDSDRQYQLELKENEVVDYIIVDGTYLDSEDFKDETFKIVRNKILERGYDHFYCRPEKIIFFSKKLMSSKRLKDDYCVVFTSEFKWYLKILKKYYYEPFITDQIVLNTEKYELPENRKYLYVSSKREEKQTNVTSLVGLHISFLDFAYMLPSFYAQKPIILVGHYNYENEKDIIKTFKNSSLTSEYQVHVLKKGEYKLNDE